MYRARLPMLRVSNEKSTRMYTGVGPVSIVLTTHNLATRERRKDEKLGPMSVEVIAARADRCSVEVYNLATHKKRVVHF